MTLVNCSSCNVKDNIKLYFSEEHMVSEWIVFSKYS
jgi:hypothetical protein